MKFGPSNATQERDRRSQGGKVPNIRHVHIQRYRGIRETEWSPNPGINAIIGAGDTGKSTLLDAIEMTLAPRRNITFSDADFFNLDVSMPINIRVTIGDLPDVLLDLDRYGSFHRGWHDLVGLVDEPAGAFETVITVRLTVDENLDPRWSLCSDRADADDLIREMPPAERQRMAPTRLGVTANHHLAWGNRSILNKLAEIPAGAGGALAEAARQARVVFGQAALGQVPDALRIVGEVAARAGVAGAINPSALLDAHGINFTGGTIALHNEDGVPLRGLGAGSSRLLIAGLQAVAGDASPFLLIDELEHGLEPYRIIRLLHMLGSKDPNRKRQVFLTTHSPVAVRELAAGQLWRAAEDRTGKVRLTLLGVGPDDQATLRACAEAFLAPKVIVCEGATEIGLMRGLDLYRDEKGLPTLALNGAALADGHGSSMISRARCFAQIGYRTCLFRDCDVEFMSHQINAIAQAGITEFHWDQGLSTEQQLCLSLPAPWIETMVDLAVAEQGLEKVNGDLRNASPNLSKSNFDFLFELDEATRAHLGTAAKKGAWFKNITLGERVGREVLGPALEECQGTLRTTIQNLLNWVEH